MHKEKNLQLRIWGWKVKNNRWIYTIVGILFLIVIPVMSFVSCKKTPVDEYYVTYGYMLYIIQTLMFGLGCIPVLMTMYITCHLHIGDCIVLFPKWNQRIQCMIDYGFISLICCFLMLFLVLNFHEGIAVFIIFKDLISLLITLWFLISVSRWVSAIGKNVYFTLILLELYVVLFWNMRIQPNALWNVFSLNGTEGIEWICRMILYTSFGFLIQYVIFPSRIKNNGDFISG